MNNNNDYINDYNDDCSDDEEILLCSNDEEILLCSNDEEIILSPNTIVYRSGEEKETDVIMLCMLLFIYTIAYLFGIRN
jgi:hypothetical protein|tara:strand:- start:714 stop:950 length:237 start_codon:yes stop_codon:yes gene_type:complete